MLLINHCALGRIRKWSGIWDLPGTAPYASSPTDGSEVSWGRSPHGFSEHLGAPQTLLLLRTSVLSPPPTPVPAPARTGYVRCALLVCPAPFPSDTNVMRLNVTLSVFLLFVAEDKLPIFLLALDAGRL